MKPIVYILINLMVLLTLHASAQEKPHEISINYGFMSVEQIESGVDQFFSDFCHGIFNTAETKLYSTGPVGISYQTTVDKFSFGTSFYYTKTKLIGNDYGFKKNYFSFFYDVKYYFLNKYSFKVYSGLSAGITLKRAHEWDVDKSPQNKKLDNIQLAYQLSPIAFQFGHSLVANLETGFGRKGMINLGVGYKF